MTSIFTFISTFFLTSQLAGPSFDPALNWRTLETEHFYIHYPGDLEAIAQRLAARAEPIYSERTKTLRWEPSEKTHLVLADSTDTPNGLASPLPYNHVILWPTPPLDGTPLDEYDDWLHTLFAHEFTHTVHLDMAEGFNKFMRYLLGRFWVPNAPQQQWAHEGLSIYYETKDTTRGRGRSAYLNMLLRTASLENQFADISRATYWNDVYPFGNTAYWYGAGFHNYLSETYGEEKIVKLLHETAKFPLPVAFQNFKSDDVFGKGLSRMWNEWRLKEKSRWTKFASENPSASKFTKPLSPKPILMTGRPFYDAASKKFYVATKSENETHIRAFWANENGELQNEIIKSGGALSLFVHDGKIFYADQRGVLGYNSFFDLIVYDIAEKKEKRVTIGGRLRDPVVVGNQILAIHTNALKTSIVSLPYSAILEAFKNDDPIEFPRGTPYFEAKGYDSIGKLAVSPNKREIAFSMKVENAYRDLYVLDLASKTVTSLTKDSADDLHPQYIDDARILFASSRYFGTSKVEVPNIFVVNRQSGEIQQATSALTGATWPSTDGQNLLTAVFHSDGWHVAHSKIELARLAPYTGGTRTDGPTKEFVSKNIPSSSYRMGTSLLPRYLAPLWFFTESDSLIGLQTGSRDPLGRHAWGAFGYALLGPNRPGASLSYAYSGIRNTSLFAVGYSGITNYGTILVLDLGSQGYYYDLSQNYYERLWGGSVGATHRFTGVDGPSNWSATAAGFYEYRQSLLSLPSNLYRALLNGKKTFPETGAQWGGRFSLNWARDFEMDVDGISPKAGKSAGLSIEYSPNRWGSEFHQLITILSSKAYFETFKNQALAIKAVGGMQWLNSLYQRTFLLGGPIGDLNPFASVNKRNYSFRGLPTSNLRGEGMLLASLEYRFPMLRHLSGMGTAPLWFKNLHAAAFADGGQTFQRKTENVVTENGGNQVKKFDYRRFSLSSGAELRSDVSMSYAPPLQYRLGYGYVFYRHGQRPLQRIDEVYFQIGSSF